MVAVSKRRKICSHYSLIVIIIIIFIMLCALLLCAHMWPHKKKKIRGRAQSTYVYYRTQCKLMECRVLRDMFRNLQQCHSQYVIQLEASSSPPAELRSLAKCGRVTPFISDSILTVTRVILRSKCWQIIKWHLHSCTTSVTILCTCLIYESVATVL